MNHLEAYKYLRDLGFRVQVNVMAGNDEKSYSVTAFLADEYKGIYTAGVSVRTEAYRLPTAIISAASLVKHQIKALEECSAFAGEEFFKLTIQ